MTFFFLHVKKHKYCIVDFTLLFPVELLIYLATLYKMIPFVNISKLH